MPPPPCPASSIHPTKISGISSTPKNIPHSPLSHLKKDLKITPKYCPILWWPQNNIHKTFIPQKIFIFLKPPKILKYKILNSKKWPEPTYVWKYQSTPLGPPPSDIFIGRLGLFVFFLFFFFWGGGGRVGVWGHNLGGFQKKMNVFGYE